MYSDDIYKLTRKFFKKKWIKIICIYDDEKHILTEMPSNNNYQLKIQSNG